jgi:hypothetical protein
MKYIGSDDTDEALAHAAEELLDQVERMHLDQCRVRDKDGGGVPTVPVISASVRLRQVLLNYERRKMFCPRSSTEQEQAASIRTVGGSSPSGGAG